MDALSLFQDEVRAMRTLRILNAIHIQRLEEGLATEPQAKIFTTQAGAAPQNCSPATQEPTS
jgi:hypothetical protein